MAMRLDHQSRAIVAMAGRLDAVQRDAENALIALTEAEGRIADLEARIWAGTEAGTAAPPY